MAVVESNWKTVTQTARWRNLRDKTVCSAVGVGVIAAFQVIARNALRPSWTSYDGAHSARNPIDGTWGPITQAALYALAKLAGASSATLSQLEADGRAHKITRASATVLVWLAYYVERRVDLDVGGSRNTTPQPPVLGPLELAQIELPEGSTLPTWNERPALPSNLDVLGAQLPTCVPEEGNTFTLGKDGTVPDIKTGTSTTTTTSTTSSSSSTAAKVVGVGLAVAVGVALSRRKRKRRR